MTDKEIAQAIRRADADALRHQLDDSKIVLCEAGIALHRRYGWGAERMRRLLADIQEIDKEIRSPKQARRLYKQEIGVALEVRQE